MLTKNNLFRAAREIVFAELDSALLSGSLRLSVRRLNQATRNLKQGDQPEHEKSRDRRVTSAVARCIAALGASRYDGGSNSGGERQRNMFLLAPDRHQQLRKSEERS